ncbi:YeiH family protein [Magnetococcales bacterium HHB-1]
MGIALWHFLRGFTLLYFLSVIIFAVGGWAHAENYNLEPPLVALLLGLLIANTMTIPPWLQSALRVEYYVKLGIILLGATFPITLIASAGAVAIGQASFISIITCVTIYFSATRLFYLDRRQAAVLSVGGSVCGVSGAMAIAAAVGAKKEHIYSTVTLVVIWALVMIVALPFAAQQLQLPPGIAGAWIGTSEFADAAGFAAASTVGKMAGNEESAIKAFTLMKVIGRDIWIGLWSLIWAIIATTVWNKTDQKRKKGVDKGEIWRRFPKFVIGFFLASLTISLYTTTQDSQTFETVIKPELLAPLGALRSWTFIFCFLSIGLSTRFGDLKKVGGGAFSAFTLGVIVNVILGFILSVYIFGNYWAQI